MAASAALWLVAIDLVLGFAARPPDDPRRAPTALQRYFDYGRSIEGKLRQMVGPTRETSAPVATVGWIDSAAPQLAAPDSAPAQVLVAGYGQSFTVNMLEALRAIDSRFQVRALGGPGAPLSHSYALYREDRGRHRARIVLLGVLASALPQLASVTNMTSAFEAPQPCTYPRFVLDGGELKAIETSVRTLDELRAALAEPARFERFAGELARYDAAYDAFVFERDWLDWSVLGRAVRRGLGQKHTRDFRARYVDQHGFTNRDHLLDVADAIFAAFAAQVRRDGQIPFVVLINDRGYGDYLYRAFAPSMRRLDIPYFSTHERAPSTKAGLFQPDGHFTPEVNAALAADLHAALGRALERHGTFNVRTLP